MLEISQGKIRPTIEHFVEWLNLLNSTSLVPKEFYPIVNQRVLFRFRNELSLLYTGEKFTSLKAIHNSFEALLKIKQSEKLKAILKGSLFFGATLLVLVIFWRVRKISKVNLLYNPPVSVRSKSERSSLYKFLKSPRFGFAYSNVLIIQDRKLSLRGCLDKQVVPVFSIDLYLVSILSLGERCKLIVKSFSNLLTFFRLIRINPTVIYSYRELILTVPCSQLVVDRGTISEIYINNSNYLSQPTTFHLRGKHIKAYMLWYSDNSFSKYRDLSMSTFDYSAFGLAKVDCHYVWTNEFASFLSQFTKIFVKNVGSILFYEAENVDLSGNSTLIEQKATRDVIVFDVIPFEKSNNYDYYTKSRAYNFLFGIQKLFEEFQRSGLISQPKFAIKHKRKLDPKHSKEYPYLVNSLIYPQGKWERLPENANLYNLIKNAKLIVAPPFTSPAIVARELGVPACFLDLGANPTEFENYCGIPVFRNYEAFSSFATRVLRSSL